MRRRSLTPENPIENGDFDESNLLEDEIDEHDTKPVDAAAVANDNNEAGT